MIPEIVQCSEVNDFIEDISFQQEPIQETFSQQPRDNLSPTQQALNQLESMDQVSSQKASTSLQHASILQPSFTNIPSMKQSSTQQTFVQQTSIYQSSVSSQQQSSIYTTPQKQSITITEDIKIGADNLMQIKLPLAKDANMIKLQDILILPKTPQRKGIKNTKKTPFVLTSAEWKVQENEKIKIKERKQKALEREKKKENSRNWKKRKKW
ncbi:unnamed protein product [Diatraea saccharalis]|uniref:Uncharacterized protein n=1 Tax=Diatraea saccharalis TaxID=40085 RepID=A0A9N9WFM8_9NEOP|nr:unnamed protein product [Diatraea saccharalis]